MSYQADDSEYIAKRMEEIKAARWKNIQGDPIEAKTEQADLDNLANYMMGGLDYDPA
jgi:hypothetical protein